jgi:hypothetical protein
LFQRLIACTRARRLRLSDGGGRGGRSGNAGGSGGGGGGGGGDDDDSGDEQDKKAPRYAHARDPVSNVAPPALTKERIAMLVRDSRLMLTPSAEESKTWFVTPSEEHVGVSAYLNQSSAPFVAQFKQR